MLVPKLNLATSGQSVFAVCALLIVCMCGPAAGQLEISVSPSPVGAGARAAGMADAFVAIADDATAASWNPAGLTQLERPELSIVGSYNGIFEECSADFHDEVDSKHHDDNLDLNYLSAVYPLPFLVLNRNVCLSLNYQRKYDFSRKFRLRYNTASATTGGTPANSFLTMAFEQEGGLSTITPAVACEITRRISVGLSLNLWRSSLLSDNSWTQTTQSNRIAFFGPATFISSSREREEYSDLSGENLTAGILWNLTNRWSLGARYDSAFTGEADYHRIGNTLKVSLPSVAFPSASLTAGSEIRRETRHIRLPDSVAVGAAFRVNDRLTLSLDVTRTDWNDFYVRDAEGIRRSLVDFSNLEDPWTRPHFDPTYTVRLGAEYIFIPKRRDEELNTLWTLRAGLFYDEEPATGKASPREFRLLDDTGSGEPDKFYGLALGCGLLTHQRVNLDAAYQLRCGDGVNSDFIRGMTGFSERVLQHRFLLSTVIYF